MSAFDDAVNSASGGCREQFVGQEAKSKLSRRYMTQILMHYCFSASDKKKNL